MKKNNARDILLEDTSPADGVGIFVSALFHYVTPKLIDAVGDAVAKGLHDKGCFRKLVKLTLEDTRKHFDQTALELGGKMLEEIKERGEKK